MTTPFEHDHPWQDRLSEYVDGLLTDAETRSLEEHLRGCEQCRASIAELRAVVERLRAEEMDSVPAGAWPRIANRLSTQSVSANAAAIGAFRRSSYPLQARTLRAIATAASLVLTLAGGIWVGALLCIARPMWSPPGWMHLGPRETRAPILRSLVALNQQLSEAENDLRSQPQTPAIQHAVERVARERAQVQRLLDSLGFVPRRQ